MQNDRGTHIWKYNRLPRYYLTIMSASRMKLHQPTPEVFSRMLHLKMFSSPWRGDFEAKLEFCTPQGVYNSSNFRGCRTHSLKLTAVRPLNFGRAPKGILNLPTFSNIPFSGSNCWLQGGFFPFLNGIPGCPTSQDFDKISQISNGLVVSTLGKSSPCLDLWPRNGDFICVFLRKLWKSTKPHQLTIKRTN